MTQDEIEQAIRLLQEQLANVDKLEARFAAAEKAAGLDPAPCMPLDQRLARLRAQSPPL